jgi:hypothetical protein
MSITSSTDENNTRTKEAMRVVMSTRKEPQLDFHTFFHLLDNTTSESVLKHGPQVTSATTNIFQLYDIVNPDNSYEVVISGQGHGEADHVLYLLANGRPELTITRNGAPYSNYSASFIQ